MQQQCFVQKRNHKHIQTICPNLWHSMFVFSSRQVPHVFCTWNPCTQLPRPCWWEWKCGALVLAWWSPDCLNEPPLLGGARSCSPSKQFGKSFPGRTGLCHSKGHVALFWTNQCLMIYPLLLQWSCRIGLPVQGWACPLLHCELSGMKVTALQAQSELFAIAWMEKRWCVAEICVGVHEEGQMIRLVCNLENNISIIYFVFAEKSGRSSSCLACVFVCVCKELSCWTETQSVQGFHAH